MALILNPLLGRHATKLWLQVLTVNETTGALAAAGSGAADLAKLVTTTGSLASNNLAFTIGIMDSVQWMSDKDEENIASAQRVRAHHVALQVGYTVTINELLHAGANAQLLANIYYGGVSSYAEVTWARGGNRWIDTFVMSSYDEDIQRGRNIAVLRLESADVGGPTYTANEQ